ncbi:hypothetical protein [Vallitalea guaymasensis]|uniref:hypothetical protein n=1 Tax=Vallitalea guaymasensis TaxID=1185412 RepID=UPI000DE23393|nr:hypothetical protein [Vallitalea guaymasensis]
MAQSQIKIIEKWLENYKHYKKMIVAYKMLLQQDESIKGIAYDQERTQATNKFHSDVENSILKKDDIQARIYKLESIINKIDISLQALKSDERLVIKMFYIDDMSWVAISIAVHVCERQCQRVRDSAIDTMQSLIFGQIEDRRTGNIQLELNA